MSTRDTKNYFGALKEEYRNPYTAGEIQLVDTFYVKYVKRVLDIILSLLAVVLTFPINVIIGIVTFFDVGRPILFFHERPGLGEKPFTIVKFRNMTNEKDKEGNLLPSSERVTQFGKFVRKTSLDELLNFWSILKGDMSLIGPRPLLMSYLPKYDLRQHKRHAVKPGLECPSLVMRDHTRTWEEQFEDDVWYVEHVSFKTDCRMIWELVKLVFNKQELNRRSKAMRNRFDVECEMKKE